MNTVTFEQARALAALGYPQGEWPQMVHQENMEGHTRLFYQRSSEEYPAWYAAPHPVDALVWLGANKGVQWMGCQTIEGDVWSAEITDSDLHCIARTGPFSDPTDLLDAVLKVLTEKEA